MTLQRPLMLIGLLGSYAAAFVACSTSHEVGGPPPGDAGDARSSSTDAGLVPGTTVDAGLYTLTVLPPAKAGSCDAHAQRPSHFKDTTKAWGLASASGNTYAADLDHDGYPDLILLSGNQDQREKIPKSHGGVLSNEADGGFNQDVAVLMNRPKPGGGRTFVDKTTESGLFQVRGGSTSEYRMAQIVAIADLDGDGNLDVFSGVNLDGNPPTGDYGSDTNEILINTDGRGHFKLAPQSAPSMNVAPAETQAVFTDIDDDGQLDLLLTYWYDPAYPPFGSQARLYSGKGDGTFYAITAAARLGTDDSHSMASLLDGSNPRPSFGATACDLNGDGFPELLVSSYGGESNMLYVNDGTGHYTRLVAPGGFDGDKDIHYQDNQYYLCYCKENTWDTSYCAGAAAPSVMCPSPVPWQKGIDDAPAMLNGNNFSAACRDVNGDGKPDVFQSTIRHWWAGQSTDPSTLLLNHTDGGAIDLARVPGTSDGVVFPHLDPWGWNEGIQQVSLVDMDNDGRVDILLGGSDYAYQYGHLFIQQADGKFEDLARQWGMFFPCMDGLTVADLDRDGDLDVVVRGSLFRDCGPDAQNDRPGWTQPGWPALDTSGAGTYPQFNGYTRPEVHVFTNDASEHSRWLEIRLRGNGSDTNTMGIGAKVSVTVNGVTQMQEMLSSHGIGSESDDPGVLFFGLGDCSAVDRVEVVWPNRAHAKDTWTDVPAGHLLELKQGDATIYGVNL